MTEQDIRQAYVRIREIDNTIPDEVLDFMKDASIEKLNKVLQVQDNELKRLKDGIVDLIPEIRRKGAVNEAIILGELLTQPQPKDFLEDIAR